MTINFKSIFTDVRQTFEETFGNAQKASQEMGSLNVKIQQLLAEAKADNLTQVNPKAFISLKNKLVTEAKGLLEQSSTLSTLVRKVEQAITITNRSPISSYDRQTLNMHQTGLGDQVAHLEEERSGFLLQLTKDFRKLNAEQKLMQAQVGQLNANFKALESHLEGNNWLVSLFHSIFSSTPTSLQETQEDEGIALPALDTSHVHVPYKNETTTSNAAVIESDEDEGVDSIESDDIDDDNISSDEDEAHLSDVDLMKKVVVEEHEAVKKQASKDDSDDDMPIRPKKKAAEPKRLKDYSEEERDNMPLSQLQTLLHAEQALTGGVPSAPTLADLDENTLEETLDNMPLSELQKLLKATENNGEPSAPVAEARQAAPLRRSPRHVAQAAPVVVEAPQVAKPSRKRKPVEEAQVVQAPKKPKVSRELRNLGINPAELPAVVQGIQTRSRTRHA